MKLFLYYQGLIKGLRLKIELMAQTYIVHIMVSPTSPPKPRSKIYGKGFGLIL